MINILRQPKGFYKNVAVLMIPMMLQNIITQTVALADTFMVGSLGETYLAAMTIAMAPLFIFMIITFGIQNGAGVLVAQYWGKGDKDTINRILGISLGVSISIMSLGATAMVIFPYQILGLITNAYHLVPIAAPYLRIVAFAHILSAISMVYIGFHRSMENPRLGLIILSVSSVLNVISNWIFIFGRFGMPALGIRGAAITTLGVRALEVLIIVIYASHNKRLPLKLKLIIKPGIMIFKDFLKFSLPVLLNEALWAFGFMLFPVILGHMAGSESILAAHTISGSLERLFAVSLFAGAGATSIIIGRELGAGRKDNIDRVAKSLMTLMLLLGLASASLFMLMRFTVLEPFIFPLLNFSEEASRAATTMITLIAFVIPLRTLGITTGIGVLRGGGDVRALMIIDVGCLYLIALPIAATNGLVLGLGVGFVYAAFLVEDSVKTLLLLRRFRSRKWINNLTRSKEHFE